MRRPCDDGRAENPGEYDDYDQFDEGERAIANVMGRASAVHEREFSGELPEFR